jgi:HK97 family phage prohead protease
MYEIIDIDGTLTTSGNTPNDKMVQYVQEDAAQEGTKFIVVSARPVSRLDETKKWLSDNKIPYDQIHLNDFAGAGKGPNVGLAFKKAKYEALIKQYGIQSASNPDGIDYAIDNDPEVIAMAKELGLRAVTPEQHLQEEGHSTFADPAMPSRALQGDVVVVPAYIQMAAQAGVELYQTGIGGADVTASDFEHGQALASGQIEVEEVGEIERMILINREKWEGIPSAEDKTDPSWPSPWAVFALLYGVDPTIDDSCEAVLGWTDTIVDRAEVDEEATEPMAEAQPHDTIADAPARSQLKDIETRAAAMGDFTVTESADGQRTFSGYAALFDSPSAGLPFTEFIKPGAFKRSLSRAAAGQKVVSFLFGHDETRALATTASGRLKLTEDAKGLRVEAKLDPADPDAAKVISMLTHESASSGMSFGFTVPKGGDSWSGEERTLAEVNLIEASILSPGQRAAYPATTGLAAVRKVARKSLGVDGDTLAAALANIGAARELTEEQTAVIDAVRTKLGTKSTKRGIDPTIAAAQLRLSAMMNEEI